MKSKGAKLLHDWYKLNEKAFEGRTRREIFTAFNETYPNVYKWNTAKNMLDDIRAGRLDFGDFTQTKPLETVPVENTPIPRRRGKNPDMFKVLIFSDCHGWLADMKALSCINNVLKRNHFDEVCINGDVVDMPYISRHIQKLYPEGILKEYTEIKELEYTRDQILAPLRASTNAKIRVRLGNHDERITKPNMLGDKQVQKLAVVYKHFQTTKFNEMLDLDPEKGFIYDPSDVYSYFDKFDVVHGLSLAKNAPEKNIQEYMSSGTSGHTHRLHAYPKTNKRNPYIWIESGHTRIGEQVEYFPTGKIPDWQQGFLDVTFYEFEGETFFHWNVTQIINGRCMYNGELISG